MVFKQTSKGMLEFNNMANITHPCFGVGKNFVVTNISLRGISLSLIAFPTDSWFL